MAAGLNIAQISNPLEFLCAVRAGQTALVVAEIEMRSEGLDINECDITD